MGLSIVGLLTFSYKKDSSGDEGRVYDGKDAYMKLPLDYTKTDSRPLLSCNDFSKKQIENLNDELDKSIKKVESPRAKTVAAVIGLVTLPKVVPYGFEQSEYVGCWMKKGFFLEDYDDGKGEKYHPWGCMVKVSPNFPRMRYKD
ncbi:hypothetical protein SAMN05444369_107106 [Capnocytophaga haemolytica]|uniref:Uncharacterized protein n=1 Tax=Capnocytophaga haemolytica TaxID=45243 RepID=A0AAX2H1I6_9FLAO|nr:hypothetical protein [Capnocytophaga haemolytica]AMD85866.1 hypothetical protein AXF12_10295 [Capnocytophaga haemolytica]SFO04426.1 hypothetical protein SAMN05444369_107106 [Capnocytophaga haemolytica]SNV15513.1 Uncharacterised protein [Capnocytophaga haemolytica]